MTTKRKVPDGVLLHAFSQFFFYFSLSLKLQSFEQNKNHFEGSVFFADSNDM